MSNPMPIRESITSGTITILRPVYFEPVVQSRIAQSIAHAFGSVIEDRQIFCGYEREKFKRIKPEKTFK